MKSYKTYLFDWDGCLAKTLDVWMDVYQDIYKKYGFELGIEEVISTSWGNCEIGPRNVGIGNYIDVWEEIAMEVSNRSKRVPLYDNSKELLISLRERNCNIAIVTSSQRRIIEPALSFHGIDEIIDTLVTEEDVSEPKPNPEIIKVAISRIGVDKRDSVIIGDTSKDIDAGNAAGIDSILVLHDENKKYYDFEELMKTDSTYSVGSLKEIILAH